MDCIICKTCLSQNGILIVLKISVEQGLPFLVSKPDKSTDTKKAVSYREKRQAVKQQEDDKRRWERMTILEV